ncbi:GPP34 family phosphoprotein [Streptomyces sp. V4-01]|uniref:GPP34 family phosphoprotein n=1 Tax=Actinacidiphila polyblastidii TaxID=3110430 RepID=A0ABU7PFP2_9ACTN|nr:GPP34 family phosphoprotein [Streptomyces sp. V4-01]
MELTPAEELLLVCSSTTNGRLSAREPCTIAVAGAVLVELALHGRVVVRERRLIAVDGGDDGRLGGQVGPRAEEWWKRVRAHDRTRQPRYWVRAAVTDKVYAKVRSGLGDRGLLRSERRRALGLFPYTRWTVTDPAAVLGIRERMARAVSGGGADERTVALVLLADAGQLSRALLPRADRRSRKETLKKLSQGPWTGEETGEAVRAVAKAVGAVVSAAQAAHAAQASG